MFKTPKTLLILAVLTAESVLTLVVYHLPHKFDVSCVWLSCIFVKHYKCYCKQNKDSGLLLADCSSSHQLKLQGGISRTTEQLRSQKFTVRNSKTVRQLNWFHMSSVKLWNTDHHKLWLLHPMTPHLCSPGRKKQESPHGPSRFCQLLVSHGPEWIDVSIHLGGKSEAERLLQCLLLHVLCNYKTFHIIALNSQSIPAFSILLTLKNNTVCHIILLPTNEIFVIWNVILP